MELEAQNSQQTQQQQQTNLFDLPELFQSPQFYENIPQDDIFDRRVECIGSYGNVKYFGKLQHFTQEEWAAKSEADKNQIWVGIEWDEAIRGRHNGTVNNFCYFKTSDNKNSATLLKVEKASFGVSIFDGIILKYFRGSPEQVKEQLLKKYADNQKKAQQENQMQMEETKITDKKPVTVEYDEDAYFETTKKHIKKVEFLGFDVIWEKINNLYEIRELSLQEMQISNLGPLGSLGKLTPHLAVLSIEKNLLFDWNQVYQIGYELKNLKSLALSGNILRKPQNVFEMQNIKVHHNGTFINKSPVNIFENLTSLILMDMKLTWKDISNILPTIPVIVELLLCRNNLNDFQNIILLENQLQYLEYMNLEENEITSFEGMKIFQHLPRFQKLNLNKNYLTELGKFENFLSMDFVSLNNNLVEECKIYSQLAQFKFLTQLRFQNNLIDQKFEKHYLRQRAIAEIKNLEIINGSDLKQFERKDCEIFYLRRTFEDYFKIVNRPHYDYDYEDCMKFCDQHHPRIRELIKKYGNPYELDTRVEEKIPIPKNPYQNAKKNVVELKIKPFAGPLQGKEQKKKFPDTTTVQTLKNVLAKLIQIPQENQIIYYQNNLDEKQVFLEVVGDYKNFINFQIKDGGDLIIDDKTVNNYKVQQ